MNAAAWLAEIERRADEYRAQRAAHHLLVGARAAAERAGRVRVAPQPVILRAGYDVEPDDDVVPRGARAAYAAALGAGWAARLVRSVAVVPGSAVQHCVTLRAARHDERAVGSWSGPQSALPGWDWGLYVSPHTGLERLGWARVVGKREVKIRGILDALEGIQLTRQVVDPAHDDRDVTV